MKTRKPKMKTNRKKKLSQWILDTTNRVNVELGRLYGEEVSHLYWETSFSLGNNKMLVEAPIEYHKLLQLIVDEHIDELHAIMYDAVAHLVETVVKTSPDRLLMTRLAYTHQYTLEDVMVGEVYDKLGIRINVKEIIEQSNINVVDIDQVDNFDLVVMMESLITTLRGTN